MSGYMGLVDWARSADVLGPALERDHALKDKKDAEKERGFLREQDYARQKEFAQNGLRWKVEDARRAGIHPLYALGGAGAAYSGPSISVGGGDSGPAYPSADMAGLGQGISRAINQTRTGEEREMAQLQLANARADLDGRTIDNQIKSTQLQQLKGGPAFPGSGNFIDGQGNSGLIKNKAMERTASMKGSPHSEPGATTSVGYLANADGSLTPVPSKDAKEKIEDSTFQEWSHAIRNNIMPNFTGGSPPPGYEWSHDHQAYRKKPNYLPGGGRMPRRR